MADDRFHHFVEQIHGFVHHDLLKTRFDLIIFRQPPLDVDFLLVSCPNLILIVIFYDIPHFEVNNP